MRNDVGTFSNPFHQRSLSSYVYLLRQCDTMWAEKDVIRVSFRVCDEAPRRSSLEVRPLLHSLHLPFVDVSYTVPNRWLCFSSTTPLYSPLSNRFPPASIPCTLRTYHRAPTARATRPRQKTPHGTRWVGLRRSEDLRRHRVAVRSLPRLAGVTRTMTKRRPPPCPEQPLREGGGAAPPLAHPRLVGGAVRLQAPRGRASCLPKSRRLRRQRRRHQLRPRRHARPLPGEAWGAGLADRAR